MCVATQGYRKSFLPFELLPHQVAQLGLDIILGELEASLSHEVLKEY